jgi:prepilin-type N-terminal cleavage/methylation domain-containing protein
MPADRGFTLVECLMALALAGFAILIGAALLVTQARAAERVEVRQILLRTAEGILESTRAGVMPLRSAPVELELQSRPPFMGEVRSSLEVQTTARPGLYRATARAGCELRGEEIVVTLDSMVFRP